MKEEKKWYLERIAELVGRIESVTLLKRVYNLVEYLYVYKDKGGAA